MDQITIALIVVVLAVAVLYYMQYIKALSADEAAKEANIARQVALNAQAVADRAAADAKLATNTIDAENKQLIATASKAEADRLNALAQEKECKSQLASLDATKTQIQENAARCSARAADLESTLKDVTSMNVSNLEKIAQLQSEIRTGVPQAYQNIVGMWYPIRGPKEPEFNLIIEWVSGTPYFMFIPRANSNRYMRIRITDVEETPDAFIIGLENPRLPDGIERHSHKKQGYNLIEFDGITYKRMIWEDKMTVNYLNTTLTPKVISIQK